MSLHAVVKRWLAARTGLLCGGRTELEYAEPAAFRSSWSGSGSIGWRAAEAKRAGSASATAAVHALPGPVGVQPAGDGLREWYVEARPVGPHPGLHRDVPLLGR